MNGENSGEFPGQNPGREQNAPDVVPQEEASRIASVEAREAKIIEHVQNDNLEAAVSLMRERNAAAKAAVPEYEEIESADFTPQVQEGFISAFNKPGFGREAAAIHMPPLNIEAEALRDFLGRIPKAADIQPEPTPNDDASQTETVPTPPTEVEQLHKILNDIVEGGSIEDALESLPEPLRATYKKPFEEVVKMKKAEVEGNTTTPENIEDFKKALIESDIRPEAAEVFLKNTNLPEEVKTQIREEIAEKYKDKPEQEDTEGASEVVAEARRVRDQGNQIADGLSPGYREQFRRKLAILSTQLEDAGVARIGRGIGKGVASIILIFLLIEIWAMQMIGRLSKKPGR
ncbi:MAG: hypothetical protein H0W89_03665 [Candidatus Levybacteria bacterium]|nr:hypothetical protein [Candidatus Levybacteria bacterium]